MFDHHVENSFLVPLYSLGEVMACLNSFCVSMSVIVGSFNFPFGSFCFGRGFGVSAVKSFVGAICFNSKMESFPGGVIPVTKWYREELVIRVGVF